MRRSGEEISFGIIVRSMIFVMNQETDRCTKGNAVFGTRLNMNRIVFGSLKGILVRINPYVFLFRDVPHQGGRSRLTAVVRSL